MGSGVSRSAGIPTGWEIVGDITRRLARLQNEEPGENWLEWYIKKFEEQPDYAKVVEAVAATPAERSSLLRGYFEPTAEERTAGLKLPTKAHQAIARLAAAGDVKVILTTNFDRLMETALEKEGVTPTVISSPGQVAGMMPLPHVKCLVMKLHGDYLDTRIKNTSQELATYDADTNHLLDHILSEFGLIICGWSGEWDVALADAVARNTRFRFSTFWMSRGKPTSPLKI